MSSHAAGQSWCTFTLDGELFGVDVTGVQEVLRQVDMTPVPLAPPDVVGLINLRGHIVTVLELRRRLGMPPRAPQATPMNVVVRHPQGVVSLLVDDIGDVVDVDQALWEPAPTTLPAAWRELIEGVARLPNGLLLQLNTNKAIAVEPATGTAKGDNHG